MIPQSFFALPLLLLDLVISAKAQDPKSKVFQWKFNNQLSKDLPTCADFDIKILPFSGSGTDTGVPPYYMIGYAINGVTRTKFIGSSANSTRWTVDYPVGTKLALSVVDSEGTSGGVPPILYNVVDGSTTNCVVNDDRRDFTVEANVTSTISTCEPWGLTIKGGVKPYNITFLQINSPIVTNATMGPQDDGFVYIMRGDPDKLMVAAVNDLTGRFAFAQTPTVLPKGSSDVECPGKVSISGNATAFAQQVADAREAANKKRAGLIAGITVPIVLLSVGVALWYWCWYKPRRNSHVKPYNVQPSDSDLDPFLLHSNLRYPPSSPNYQDTEYNPYLSQHQSHPSHTSSGLAPYSVLETGRQPRSKAVEAGYGRSTRPASSDSTSPLTTYRHHGLERSDGAGTTVSETEDEVIIQHQDGGPGKRVKELPPPYVDRGNPS